MKVIGQAVARSRGQYPVLDSGACALIEPGQTFDIFDSPGLPAWADEVPPPEPPRQLKARKTPAVTDIA